MRLDPDHAIIVGAGLYLLFSILFLTFAYWWL